jgi:hypothetical protein
MLYSHRQKKQERRSLEKEDEETAAAGNKGYERTKTNHPKT